MNILKNIINWFAMIFCHHRVVNEGWAFQQQRIRWCTNCKRKEFKDHGKPYYKKLKKKKNRTIHGARKVDLDNE